MTLILAAANFDLAIIAADTRLSWNGTIVDDHSPKVGCLKFYDGVLISAYTGLARSKNFVTREWFLSALCAGTQPWTSTLEALACLRTKITEEFRTNRELQELPAQSRKLSLVFSGFIDGMPVGAVISNFEEYQRAFASVQDDFVLTRLIGTDPSGSWTGYFGARAAVEPEDRQHLNEITIAKKDAIAIKGKCHAIIARAAASPYSAGTIGSGILTATLEKNGVCSSWYSAENDEDKMLSIDHFSSVVPDGGGFAIHGLQISAPGIVEGRSKRRGRGGMHQPPR